MFKELLLDLGKLLIQIARGFAICVVGLIMFNWHRTLNNPASDAIILWQSLGAAVIFVGFTDIVKTWRLGKSPEEKRHEEIIERLTSLEKTLVNLQRKHDLKDEALISISNPSEISSSEDTARVYNTQQ